MTMPESKDTKMPAVEAEAQTETLAGSESSAMPANALPKKGGKGTGILQQMAFVFAAGFVLFHIYTSIFGVLPGTSQRAVHLGFMIVVFYLTELAKPGRRLWVKLIEAVMLLAGAGGIAYLVAIDASLQDRIGRVFTMDIFFAILLIVSLLYATSRVVGNSLAVVTVIFILYGFLGNYFPGFLRHSGFTMKRFVTLSYLSNDGIFGTALYSSATYIVLFILLGAILQETGVGDYFTTAATALFGKSRGGPAKVAVVASGFFGSISGSAIANVIGTGTFTIPLMKKTGFEPEYAAGVEAAASTGGQIMPPVMGATAFLLAEMLGIPYFDLVKAALIPAILYYVGILIMVDLYSKKKNIQGVDPADIPSLKTIIKRVYLFIPLVFLIFALGVWGLTINRAGLYTCAVTLVVVMLNADTRLNWQKIKRILMSAAKGTLPVAIACAIVGVITCVIMGSGMGFRLSSILIDVANGNMLILLVLTMLVSLILGMGMPTTAAYLVLAVLVAPALVQMGVQPLAAHLFIFYYGIISAITPPVALAAYAAAGVAHCNPNKTGFKAFKLAISGFILPFIFVYNPVMLWQGAWYDILLCFVSAVIGVYCLSAFIEGFAFEWKLNWAERIVLLAAALALIIPGLLSDLAGLAVLVLIFLFHKTKDKRKPAVSV